MLFGVGKVHISKAVLASSITSNDLVSAFAQYISGGWGGTSFAEEIQNDTAIAAGERIVGRYFSEDGQLFCITTFEGSTQIVLGNIQRFHSLAEGRVEKG